MPGMPPLEMGGELEGDIEDPTLTGEMPLEPDDSLDPMFAADISEAFPDLDDDQLIALQRAIRGLMATA